MKLRDALRRPRKKKPSKRDPKVTRHYKDVMAARVRKVLEAFRAAGCAACGIRVPEVLTAHHRDPKDKLFTIGSIRSLGVGPKTVAKELAKCVCLCANCHLLLHKGLLSL